MKLTTGTCDSAAVEELLDDPERAVLHAVQNAMANRRDQIVNPVRDSSPFPFDSVPEFGQLGLAGLTLQGYGFGGASFLLDGSVHMEIARVDPMLAIRNNTHSGLAMRSICHFGSSEQKARFLSRMFSYATLGSFAIPERGFAASPRQSPALIAELVSDEVWLLNGQARCIGGDMAWDVMIAWAWAPSIHGFRAFIVHNDLAGIRLTSSAQHTSPKAAGVVAVTFDNVEILESNRLALASRSSDVAAVLTCSRATGAWIALGYAHSVYGMALQRASAEVTAHVDVNDHALARHLLAVMGENISASTNRCVQLARLLDKGKATLRHSTITSMYCARLMRDNVALGTRVASVLNRPNSGPRAVDSGRLTLDRESPDVSALLFGGAVPQSVSSR
ncbi:acyl-CoA dehydrogenase family protein [Mycolicibacterium sp. CR10]|uniref:acyl-CoA dehydrogenase family protein n=1 Tax=Mycolicibacterium sp. CR10 TaxID=2562314 RepID=UPI0010BFF35F|nr:acyl-CoA dehydrogenase family protein [Mycolicibacterium sp. CR10]